MPSRRLSDAQWARLAPIVASLTRRGPKGRDDRSFVEAVAWILRTGAPWRDLPRAFGIWSTIYRRFRRWALAGRWEALRSLLRPSSDAKSLLIDSTIIKAHPHAAGARGGQVKQALGRSRGGFTTKVHAVTAEDGTLLRFVLTPGQVHDITEAKRLIPQRDGNRVVADRAYDCNAFIAHIEALGMTAVIPSRARRKVIRPLDRNAYRTRNVIERVFGRLKQARRVATRYDKTRASYSSFVAAASIVTVLSGWRA